MKNDNLLREHLQILLNGDGAHADFAAAIEGIPPGLQGKAPKGSMHSPWQLLEHLRIAQWDILQSMRDAGHTSPEFPGGYWPSTQSPANEKCWSASASDFRADRDAIIDLVLNENLFAQLPPGGDSTILRKVLLAADHNAYHIGQIVLLRRLLGAWQ